ncbi:MAG: hypothetical protein BYD32DRAFT_431807 [Podila humilis]|nr:MAG: hypothetical protein BYD32DRAFT_431807 [Podila humilis]
MNIKCTSPFATRVEDTTVEGAQNTVRVINNFKDNVCFAVKELDLTSLYSGHAVKVSPPFLRRCHNLEKLRLGRVYIVPTLREIAADIRICWPALEHIDLRAMLPIRNSSDQTQAELLVACGARNQYGELRTLIMFPSLEPCPISVTTLMSTHALLRGLCNRLVELLKI